MEAAYLSRWAALQTSDVMRNKHYDLTARRVTGPLGAVAQLNPEHIRTKRPPSVTPAAAAAAAAVSRPFNPAAFNFTKCSDRELLATLSEPASEEMHYIYINVNPLLTGHGLVVPARDACHPQVLTRQLLHAGARIFAAASAHRPDFKLGFNSVGAWASVNHCHMHCFFVSDVFPDGRAPVERAPSEILHSWPQLQLCRHDWALPGLVFRTQLPRSVPPVPVHTSESDSSASRHSQWVLPVMDAASAAALRVLCEAAGAYLEHLVAVNCAHTMLMWRSPAADDIDIISIAVFARQFQQGGGAEAGEMAIALAEVAGIGIVYTQADFDGLTGEEYERRLQSASLHASMYAELVNVAAGACRDAVAADSAWF